MSRRGQTNARTSSYSRRVPIPSGRSRVFRSLPDRNDRPGFDRSIVVVVVVVGPPRSHRGTRKCISGFLCSRGSRRAAPQLPEITCLPAATRAALFLPAPPPFSSLRRFRRPSHADLLPLSASVHLFFPIPLRSPSYSSRLLLVSATRASPPAACRKPLYLSTHLSFSLHSLSLTLSFSLFRARVDTVRYIKPLGDIFSRRPWRKKKPNISWRQIVIGACTTGTVPLSADRSLVAGETVQRG